MIVVDDMSGAIAAALEQVGPRLERIRAQRRLTLTDLERTTGVSKSTRSRLETGQRRPTLELLLALSLANRVPLDDLVGAPEVDTRVPHWFGSAGEVPAEILSIFARPGERMSVRTEQSSQSPRHPISLLFVVRKRL